MACRWGANTQLLANKIVVKTDYLTMKFLRYIFFAAAVASAAAVSAKKENACVNKVADCDRLAEAAAVAGCKIFPGGTLDFLGPVHCREPTVRTVVMRRMIPTIPWKCLCSGGGSKVVSRRLPRKERPSFSVFAISRVG